MRSISTIDDLLNQHAPMFYFFLRKEAFLSARKMKKWSRESLDEYILLPWGQGMINRDDCVFISHFWRSKEHPDPDGKYLRLLQGDLSQTEWSYAWVDYMCTPQTPRDSPEAKYFTRSLETVSYLIRNCSFMYYYPPFEPRLWVLYEIAEYMFTCVGPWGLTSDVHMFLSHVNEMKQIGVRPVLEKYGYRCTSSQDRAFLTARLEFLVIMRNLNVDIMTKRWVMDALTWQPNTKMTQFLNGGSLTVDLKGGQLQDGQTRYNFTPFPDISVVADSA